MQPAQRGPRSGHRLLPLLAVATACSAGPSAPRPPAPPPACATVTETRALAADGYLGRALRRLDRAETACEQPALDTLRAEVTGRLTVAGSERTDVSADDRRAASLLYRDAIHRRVAGDRSGAVAQLERSFARYPHPFTLVQIGIAERDAGREVEARVAFARALYLAEKLAGAPATPTLVRGHAGLIGLTRAVAYAPDGRAVVTGATDPYAIEWDAVTGRPAAQLGLHDFWINDVAYSPDGTLIATAAGDGHVRAWSRASSEPVFDLVVAPRQAMALAFTPDGTTLLVGDGNGALHWIDVAAGAVTRRIDTGHRSILAIALDPDGSLLASAHEDGFVQLTRVADGSVAAGWTAHRDQCWDVAFSRDGDTLYTGGQDGAVRTWTRTGGPGRIVRANGAPASAIAVSRDGVVAFSDTKTITLVAPAGDPRTINAHAFDLAFSPDGARLASAGSAGAAIWDPATGERVHELASASPPIRSMAVTPDGALITADTERILLWPLGAGDAPRPIAGASAPGRLAIDDHGEVLAIEQGDHLAFYAMDDLDAAPRVVEASDRVNALAFGGSAHNLGVATGRGLEIWDAVRGVRAGQFLVGRKVSDLAMRGDGTRAAAAVEREAVMIDLAARTEGPRLIGHLASVVPVFIAGGVATGGHDHRIGVWTGGGRLVRWMRGHKRAIWTVAASSRGEQLATASSEGWVRVWRIADGTESVAIHAHDSWVSGLAFIARDQILATAAHEGTIRLWRASDGAQLAVMTTSRTGEWIAATPEGRIDGSPGAVDLVDWRVGAISLPGFVGWQRNREPGLLRALGR